MRLSSPAPVCNMPAGASSIDLPWKVSSNGWRLGPALGLTTVAARMPMRASLGALGQWLTFHQWFNWRARAKSVPTTTTEDCPSDCPSLIRATAYENGTTSVFAPTTDSTLANVSVGRDCPSLATMTTLAP